MNTSGKPVGSRLELKDKAGDVVKRMDIIVKKKWFANYTNHFFLTIILLNDLFAIHLLLTINPDSGSPELQTHYENIKRMVKEKTGRAMQEKERERKGKNGKIIKYYLSDRTRHCGMCVGLARSAKGVGASHRCKSSCTRMRGIG